LIILKNIELNPSYSILDTDTFGMVGSTVSHRTYTEKAPWRIIFNEKL
jgi:hypothetical protein